MTGASLRTPEAAGARGRGLVPEMGRACRG